MIADIEIIEGGLAIDDRGCLSFANKFDFKNVKRFYQVENFSPSTVRAWHGHLKEGKYVYVANGSIILGAVPMDNTEQPNKEASVKRFIMSSKKPFIVYIPPGYANGFKALEDNTKILFFSTTSLEDSKGDDFRFPFDYWGASVWETENR
jgi:dTDP-4-dehydrorhamnose 3,5-epimerase-like enzyme